MRADASALSHAAHPKRIETRGCFHVPQSEIRRSIGRARQNVIHQRAGLQIAGRDRRPAARATPRRFPGPLRRQFAPRPASGSQSFRSRARPCSAESRAARFPDRFPLRRCALHKSKTASELRPDIWPRFSPARVFRRSDARRAGISASGMNSSASPRIITPPLPNAALHGSHSEFVAETA